MTLPLFLIGARGSGKTTVGQALAERLGWLFCDTDKHLQQSWRMSVSEMVACDGWDLFRQRETQSLKAVTAPSTVIATGGGTILAKENRLFMQSAGYIVYLHAHPAVLAARLTLSAKDTQRPSLTGRPIDEEVVEVLASREALYRATAHYIVNAMRPPASVVRDIVQNMFVTRRGDSFAPVLKQR